MPKQQVGGIGNLDPLTLFNTPTFTANANVGAGRTSGIFDNFVGRPANVTDNRGGTSIPAPALPASNVPWTPSINPSYTNNTFQPAAYDRGQDARVAADAAFRSRYGLPGLFEPNRPANVTDNRTGGIPPAPLASQQNPVPMTMGPSSNGMMVPPAAAPNSFDPTAFYNMLAALQTQAANTRNNYMNALNTAVGADPYQASKGSAAEWLASLGDNLGYLKGWAQSGQPISPNGGFLQTFIGNGGDPTKITGFLNQFLQNGSPTSLDSYLKQFATNGLPTTLDSPYLRQFAQSPLPVDALPAWQTYVGAMQRNNDMGAAQLMEMFNNRGGYQSTSFGNAAVDYQTQIQKDQNALLAQMGYASLSDALGRQLEAGTTLDTLNAQLAEAAKGRQYGASGALDQLNAQLQEAAKNRQFAAAGTMEQLTTQLAEAAKARQFSASSIYDQMNFQGQSDALNRQFQAASQLGNMGFQGASQLAGYDFQSQMAQYQASLQAAMALGQQAFGATQQLGQYGNAASNQLLQNAIGGTNALFSGSQNALNSLFGNQANLINQLIGTAGQTYGQQMSGASQLAQLFQQYLGLGGNLGQQQYGNLQSQLGALYQEWLRTQPQYNPLLPYLFQGATGYVPTQQTSSPSFWDYFTQILGAGMGAAGTAIGGIYSDERLKENIEPIGRIRDVDIYEYNFKGLPGKQVGVLAQEVVKTHPRAVIPGNDSKPWMVNYKQLTDELMLAGRAA